MRVKQNKKESKRQWKCKETGVNFFNYENYFKHQQKVREWEKLVPKAILKALEMLKVTYPNLELISNDSKYEIIQDDEGISNKMEHFDIKLKFKYKGKEFETASFYFRNIDITCATGIYFSIIRYYILPLDAGFNSFEKWELSKLSKYEQATINQELDKMEQLYMNYYIDSEVQENEK